MMAIYKQFGDSYQYKLQLPSTTLAQLMKIEVTIHPWDFASYLPEAKQLHLDGIHWPFWRDWPLAKPSVFLTPEPLHHWHKMFWDHDAKWCIYVVGATEINFWFSILQPYVGFHHFWANSTVIQFSTDVTECMHITKIKNLAHTGNNQNHESQICHDLDHTDKHCCFELAMSIHAPHSIPSDYSENEHTEQSSPFAQLITSSLQSPNNYFDKSAWYVLLIRLGSGTKELEYGLYSIRKLM